MSRIKDLLQEGRLSWKHTISGQPNGSVQVEKATLDREDGVLTSRTKLTDVSPFLVIPGLRAQGYSTGQAGAVRVFCPSFGISKGYRCRQEGTSGDG